MDSSTVSAYLIQYPEVGWALAAIAFFILEVAVISGIGFFFAALGGLTLSFLYIAHIAHADMSFTVQLALFFLLTAGWAGVLWRPLKNRNRRLRHHYDTYAGTKAFVVDAALLPGKQGRVKWSGAVMGAILAPGQDAVAVGEEVTVVSQSGSVLTVIHVELPGTLL